MLKDNVINFLCFIVWIIIMVYVFRDVFFVLSIYDFI